MAYEQYMKHSKNHIKDRYCQQCSGYFGKSLKELREEEQVKEIKYYIIDKDNQVIAEANSYDEIIDRGKVMVDKKYYWIANNNMFMGRLDLVCGT